MTHAFDPPLSHLLNHGRHPSVGVSARDIVVSLADALGPTWSVQRETDFAGDVSIVVMPVIDSSATPTFILYEADGQAHVGTVRDDGWEADRGFDTLQKAAMIGIIAEINLLSAPEAC